jgi:hypothetical protein
VTTAMSLVQDVRNQAPAYKPHPGPRLFVRPILMLALCLAIRLPLYAQNPVFAETPDDLLHFIAAAHPEVPAQTSFDIAVIETNAPDYLVSSDKMRRSRRLDGLMTLEVRQLKADPDVRGYWYEFIKAKAPELTESEINAIAQEWWSVNGYRAVMRDERGDSKSASLKEVRAHFQMLRTGNETQVNAAEHWLMMAQIDGHWARFRLPPQVEGISPLANLLARDISKEAMVYTGEEAEKLRQTVRSLLADKFMVEGDAGIAHIVSSSDVDALLDGLLSENDVLKRSALELLQQWLKRAIDADVKRYADGSPANSLRSH